MKIEIYSKEGCTFCDQAKIVLDMGRYSYTEYKLEQDYTKEQFIEKFGQSTFPRILINDNLIGGFTELKQMILENTLEAHILSQTI